MYKGKSLVVVISLCCLVVAIGSCFYVLHINKVMAEQMAIQLRHNEEAEQAQAIVREKLRIVTESKEYHDNLKEQMHEKGVSVASGQQPASDSPTISQGTYTDIEGTGRRFSAGESIKGHIIIFDDNNYAYINSSIKKCPWPGMVYEEGVSKSVSGFHDVDPLKEHPSAYYDKSKNKLYFPYGGM